MSLRLPRPAHDCMKDLASQCGLRAAEFYAQTSRRSSGMSCRSNDAVHITINISSEFARTVRQVARDRRVSANELIYTAVCHKVDELSERAA